jgi:hypothetical protein
MYLDNDKAIKWSTPKQDTWELTSHKSNNRHKSVAMQRLVDFISMVTQQYVTTQQYCNALLVGFTVGRYIRNSPLLCNGWRNYTVTRAVLVGRSVTYKRNTQADPRVEAG